MIEQPQKLVNRLLKSSATVALLSAAAFNQVAQANEVTAPAPQPLAPTATPVAVAPVDAPAPSTAPVAEKPVEAPAPSTAPVTEKPVDTPAPSTAPVTEKPVDTPAPSTAPVAEKPVDTPAPSTAPVAEQPVEAPVKEAPKTVEEAKVAVALAEADLKVAEQLVTVAQDAVDKQVPVVTEAQKAEEATEKAVEDAKIKLDEAKKIAAEATPENITALETTLTNTQALQKTATEVANTKQQDLDVQTKDLEAARTELTEAENAVKGTQEDIKRVQEAIKDPEAVRSQLEAAQSEVTRLTTEINTLTAELANKQPEVANQIATDILTKQAEVTRLQAEITRLQNNPTPTIENIPHDATGGNTLVLPSGFPTATVRRLIDAGYGASQALIDQAARETAVFTNTAKAQNAYQSIAADVSKTVDVRNLTSDQQNELAHYVAGILNPVREQLGLSKLEVTPGAQKFASDLAAHINSRGALPAEYHDEAAIKRLAIANGLTELDAFGYEAVGASGDYVQPTNMDELKRGLHYSLVIMLFEDHIWGKDKNGQISLGHLRNFLRNDSSKVYLGVDVSGVPNKDGGNYNQHLMFVPERNIVSASFDKTTMASTRPISVDKVDTGRINELTGRINSLNTELTTLQGYQANPANHPILKELTGRKTELENKKAEEVNKVTTLTSTLSTLDQSNQANSSLLTNLQARLNTELTRLNDAKTALNTETRESEVVKRAFDTAKAEVERLTKEVETISTLLAKYKDPNLVANAEKALENAEKQFGSASGIYLAEKAELDSLKSKLADARKLYDEKQEELKQAKLLLAKLQPTIPGVTIGAPGVVSDTLTSSNKGSGGATQTGDKGEKQAALATPTGGAGAGQVTTSATPNLTGLTNRVLTQKASASSSASSSQAKTLPATGDKASLVASVLGTMMLAGVAMSAYKRKEN